MRSDMNDLAAMRLLAALGRCHARLRDFAISVKTWPEVTAATHSFNIDALPADCGPAFRIYDGVGVELTNGEALDWLIEINGGGNPPKFTLEVGLWRVES